MLFHSLTPSELPSPVTPVSQGHDSEVVALRRNHVSASRQTAEQERQTAEAGEVEHRQLIASLPGRCSASEQLGEMAISQLGELRREVVALQRGSGEGEAARQAAGAEATTATARELEAARCAGQARGSSLP